MTFYYTNQQSNRLMFYHDHALGITRLNVYAGEAAGYLIVDPYEEDLINGTNNTGINPTSAKAIPDQADLGPLYKYGIPWSSRIRPLCRPTSPSRILPGVDITGAGRRGYPAISGSPMWYETNQTGVATGPWPERTRSAGGTTAPGSGRRPCRRL